MFCDRAEEPTHETHSSEQVTAHTSMRAFEVLIMSGRVRGTRGRASAERCVRPDEGDEPTTANVQRDLEISSV